MRTRIAIDRQKFDTNFKLVEMTFSITVYPYFSLQLLMLIRFFFSFSDRAFAEKQRYDGWYNNLAHPDWGSAGK